MRSISRPTAIHGRLSTARMQPTARIVRKAQQNANALQAAEDASSAVKSRISG